jgi:hypothetical protein
MSLWAVQTISRRALAQLVCKEQMQNISRNTYDAWNGVHVGEQGLGLENAQANTFKTAGQ